MLPPLFAQLSPSTLSCLGPPLREVNPPSCPPATTARIQAELSEPPSAHTPALFTCTHLGLGVAVC